MDTIVVGVTHVATAEDAATQAAALARALGARLHLVSAVKTATSTMGADWTQWLFEEQELAEAHVAELAVRLGDGIEVSTAVRKGDPAAALCAEAEALDASMIVVGSVRTQGVGRILGSVAADVLKQAPCAVHVAKTT